MENIQLISKINEKYLVYTKNQLKIFSSTQYILKKNSRILVEYLEFSRIFGKLVDVLVVLGIY